MTERKKPARKIRLLQVQGVRPALIRRRLDRETKRIKLPGDCGIPIGWARLLRWAVLDLDALAVRRDLDFEIVDVKEKWGSLRISLDDWPVEADEIVERAEDESESTCAACGRPGGIVAVGGWVTPLCRIHKMLGELDGRVKRRK